jgi:hypothetical protein
MLFEYLVAVSIATLGMLGLLHLASEIAALQATSYQVTVAGWVLEEWAAMVKLAGGQSRSLTSLCNSPPDPSVAEHCSIIEIWLQDLPDSILRARPDGSLRIDWLDPAKGPMYRIYGS